jgi:hypothetical protein
MSAHPAPRATPAISAETAGSSGLALGPNHRGKGGGESEASIPVMAMAHQRTRGRVRGEHGAILPRRLCLTHPDRERTSPAGLRSLALHISLSSHSDSAFGADLAAHDQHIRSLSVMVMTSGLVTVAGQVLSVVHSVGRVSAIRCARVNCSATTRQASCELAGPEDDLGCLQI